MPGALLALLAAGGYVVSISNVTVSDTGAGLDAGYSLQNDGTIDLINSGGPSSGGNWVTPAATPAALFEVRATLNSGSLDAGTTGSWLALSTSRTWSTGAGNTANLTIEIRRASDSTVLDSATIDLDATGA